MSDHLNNIDLAHQQWQQQSQERCHTIAELTALGFSVSEIVEKLKVHERTVQRHRVHYHTGHLCFDEKREEIADICRRIGELTKQGMCSAMIAEQLGITKRTVTRHRAHHRTIPARRVPPRMTSEEKDRALLLLQEGASAAEVARTLGRGDKTIRENFPEYRFTKQQAAEAAALGRAMARLERKKQQ